MRTVCRRAVKPPFRCPVHGELRTYYAYLATLKNWCIVWCCVAILPLTYVLSELKISLSWVYLFMGILIGPAVVPITLCMFWAQLTGRAMIAGTMGGVIIGLSVWLSVAASLEGGLQSNYFFVNTGAESSMFWGNLSAIATGGLITFICSLFNRSEINTSEIWENTRDVDNPLSPWTEMYARELGITGAHMLDKRPSLIETRKVFRSAKLIATIGATVLSVCLVVIWPLCAMTTGVMNLSQFTSWINVSRACGYLGAVVIILLPLVDEIMSIWTVVKGKKTRLVDESIISGSSEPINKGPTNKPNGNKGRQAERKETPRHEHICALCFQEINEMKKEKRFVTQSDENNKKAVCRTDLENSPNIDHPESVGQRVHPEKFTVATVDSSTCRDSDYSSRFTRSFTEANNVSVADTMHETKAYSRYSLTDSISSSTGNPRDPVF